MAVGSNNKVRKVHIFGVDFEQRHLFDIASIAGIENSRFYTQSKGSYQDIVVVVMLVAPIDGVAYNSQNCQIIFSKYFRNKIWRICYIQNELNQNRYKFGLNDYRLNSNWTKSISFSSSIWPSSSTKL